MNRVTTSFLLIVLACAAGFSQQRPLLTDDIDITPSGAVELGVGIEFQQDAKFPLSGLRGDLTRVGDIRKRTGLASNVELQIEGTLQNFLAINSRSPAATPLSVAGQKKFGSVKNGTSRLNVFGNLGLGIMQRKRTDGTESLGQFRIGAQVKASGLRFDAAGLFGLTKFSPRTGIIFGVTYLSPSILPIAR